MCGMYPDIEKTTATTTIAGVAPPVTMGLRRALELKEAMVAAVTHASVTHVTVKMTKMGSNSKPQPK
ncbi:unnamed protein product [Camellia sinensis]